MTPAAHPVVAPAGVEPQRPGTFATVPAPVRRLRRIALLLLLTLIALGLAWELAVAPTGRGTLALKVLPLAFAVVGLSKHRLYTYRWLSLLVWLYVAEGVVRATSEGGPGRWLATGELVLGLGLFTACAAYVRLRLRRDPA